jgi:hypothetical protein
LAHATSALGIATHLVKSKAEGLEKMAKALVSVDTELLSKAKEQALDLLNKTFAQARERGAPATAESKPPLFPNGIELIHVKFEIGMGEATKLAIDVEVAGPKPA